MRISLKNRLPYTTLTLLVLAVFYGIYFAKVLAQKQRGIQTRQIGRRKEPSVHTVEILMSVATLGAPIAQLLSTVLGRGYERHCAPLPGMGGKGFIRCAAPCKWTGILEAGIACLPAVFFRAMNS